MRKGSYSEELLWNTTSRGHRRGLDADATGRKCEASPGTVLLFKEMDAAPQRIMAGRKNNACSATPRIR